MPKPEHMSQSQLSAWLHCGKSYQLKRVLDAPGKPSIWLVAGVALHDTFLDINRAHTGMSDPVNPHEAFEYHYREATQRVLSETGIPVDTWRRAGRATKDKPEKEDWNWWLVEGKRQCSDYQQFLRTSGWGVYKHKGTLMAEFETTSEFGGMMVKGFLDAVMTNPNGQLRVIDYKSGTRIPANKTQLGLYQAALKRTLDLDISGGAYYMTRKGEMTEEFDLKRYTPEYFDKIFSMAKVAMDNDVFIPNPGDACNMCDVSDYCYAVGGPDAWQYDPDHPQYTPSSKES